MERMDSDRAAAPLQAVFDAARQFGLRPEEVLETCDETLAMVGGQATVSEFLDELNGTLAQHILVKERSRSDGLS